MTLEEAIEHYEGKAEGYAEEYNQQIADWLSDYKRLKEKESPTKPTCLVNRGDKDFHIVDFECPSCHMTWGNVNPTIVSFCARCGKAIDFAGVENDA